MILHIVRSGETVRAIADNYQCEISDITSNNLHITDFKNLKPGMKLRIPFLSKPIIDTLEETESFISDYYPSIDTKFNKKEVPKDVVIVEEPKPEPIDTVLDTSVTIENIKNTEEKAQINNRNYSYGSVMYTGNIMPNIPEKFIKKI